MSLTRWGIMVVAGLAGASWAAGPAPPGLSVCVDLSGLCYPPSGEIRLAGTTAGEGEGLDFALLAPGESATILSVEGPAVIHRIWSTSEGTKETRLALRLDGEEQVLWDRGRLPEGEAVGDPLRAMDGQAYWSYVPVGVNGQAEFVATDLREPGEAGGGEPGPGGAEGRKFYLQVAYSEGSEGRVSDEMVEAIRDEFRLSMDAPLRVLTMPAEAGPEGEGAGPVRSTIRLEAGVPATIEGSEKTIIEAMVIDVGDASFEELRGTRLVMRSDGAQAACVDVPLPHLFCAYWDTANCGGLATAIEDGKLVLRLPIPIGRGLEVSLAKFGEGESLASAEMTLITREHDDAPPYRFCAAYRELVSKPGEPLHLAQIEGEGVLIGCTLGADGLYHHRLTFLEGNEQIYVDGAEKPTWEGTGTEDFFNGAWYFSGGVKARAFHGLTYLNEGPPPRMSAYRLLIPDRIAFKKSLKFDMQHGSSNTSANTLYKCVTIWYQTPPCQVSEPVEITELPENPMAALTAAAEEEAPSSPIDGVTLGILCVILLLAVVAGVKYLFRRVRARAQL